MTIKYKNNAVGYLSTAISASDTGIALQAGNGASFPTLATGEYFYATLVSAGGTTEVVEVTARSGDSMTAVRASEGTTAQSFAAGSRIEQRVTAQTLMDALTDTLGDGAWNGTPTRIGSYFLWIDSSGRLRIKSSAPASDTDGTIVGTQS